MYRTHEDAEEDRVQQAASNAYLNGSHPGSNKEDSSLTGDEDLDPLQNTHQESGKDFNGGRFGGLEKEKCSRNINCNDYSGISLVLVKLCKKKRSVRGMLLCCSLFSRIKKEIHIEIIPLQLSEVMCFFLNRKHDFKITK